MKFVLHETYEEIVINILLLELHQYICFHYTTLKTSKCSHESANAIMILLQEHFHMAIYCEFYFYMYVKWVIPANALSSLPFVIIIQSGVFGDKLNIQQPITNVIVEAGRFL